MEQIFSKLEFTTNGEGFIDITNDLNLLADRILKLDKHFDLARKDLDEIKISHRKIENRGNVITSIDVSDKKKLTE